MKFLVLSRREIETFKTNKKHIVISITDPELWWPNLKSYPCQVGAIFIKFPDFDRKVEGYKYNDMIFGKEKAHTIWTFFSDYKDKIELVVCQCEAGISRSSAVAGALAKAIGQDDSYFFKHYLPNRLVYNTLLLVAKGIIK